MKTKRTRPEGAGRQPAPYQQKRLNITIPLELEEDIRKEIADRVHKYKQNLKC